MDYELKLKKNINYNNLNHAYLIEVDNNYNVDIIINIIKEIIKNEINDLTILEKIFNQIENNSFPDLKIINSENSQIKKDEILKLLSEFSNKSTILKERFYIIEYAENLNISAANSMLKFLEEPCEGIVAILITKNIYSVLETIVSRCQCININFNNNCYTDEEIKKVDECLKILFKYKKKSIAYLSELYDLTSSDLKKFFSLSELIVKEKIYEKFINNNSIEFLDLISTFNKIQEANSMFNYNVNTRIILDNFILGGELNE